MATDPVTIQLLNPTGRVFTGEPLPLHIVIRCPPDGKAAELQHIGSKDEKAAELDCDLFERDLCIQPGEVYRCAASLRFQNPGHYPNPLCYLQVSSCGKATIIWVPTPTIHVVASLLKEVRVKVESICTYDYGTKIDVTVTHTGSTKFEDFKLTVGPADAVRSGVSDQRRPEFSPTQVIKFTTVIAAGEMELTFDGKAAGEQVGPVSLKVPVPPVRDVATTAPFRFLEPKKLTQAQVIVRTLDEANTLIVPTAGVHEVYGGGSKYRVEIKPAHPNVASVRLRGVSGSVEVTDMPGDPGTWSFQMVVVTNGVLTAPVELYYDVTTADGPQQGELNLAVRPQNAKLWLVAATAGAAVTVKGVAAALPTLANPGDLWNTLGVAFTRVDTLWDLIQFLSIPVIRFALWFVDRVLRPFQDG